jgi:hypothetical protein
MRRKWGHFTREKHPSCTQNRAVPTHHRTPDAPRWRSRLALDVGEGQKQTRCIDSPVRRRGGVERGENGVILHGKSTPPAHRTGLFRPTDNKQAAKKLFPRDGKVWSQLDAAIPEELYLAHCSLVDETGKSFKESRQKN